MTRSRPTRLGWFAATRLRLGLATAFAAAIWAATTFAMARFIREDATSNAAVLLLLLGYAFLGLVVAFGAAGLIGDRVFSGGWRERFLVGLPERRADELELPKSNHVFGFSALVVVVVIGLGFVSEHLSDGVLADYRFSGARRVTLRGGDMEAKHEVLARLGEERREERVEAAVELIDVVWRDPRETEATRREALSALGGLLDYLNSAIDSWRIEGKVGRWQETLAVRLRGRLGPEVRQAWRQAQGGLASDLMRVVGLLRDTTSERELVDAMLGSMGAMGSTGATGWEPDAPWVAAVQALAEVRTVGALAAVGLEGRRLAARVELPETAHDLLALATSKLAFAYHFARPQLDTRTLPDAERETLGRLVAHWADELKAPAMRRRCAAAIVLMRLRHGDALDTLLAAFDAADVKDVMCETEVVLLGLGRGEALGARIHLRRRLLDAIGVLSGGNQQVANWADGHLANANSLEPEVEAVLTDLRRRIF